MQNQHIQLYVLSKSSLHIIYRRPAIAVIVTDDDCVAVFLANKLSLFLCLWNALPADVCQLPPESFNAQMNTIALILRPVGLVFIHCIALFYPLCLFCCFASLVPRAGFTCWGSWANNLIGALLLPFLSFPPLSLPKGVRGVIPEKYFEILDACR